ncbi:hypothetical protein AUJ63_05260 [Candidatus Pacearchaeota archaeon CG1_02_35_32]|nr:MAG: hypothetical protein AUJ63_05260 [Candidatus Pacearchaeota archaeon CG1_02_35_32]
MIIKRRKNKMKKNKEETKIDIDFEKEINNEDYVIKTTKVKTTKVKTIKLHHVFHTGANIGHYHRILDLLNNRMDVEVSMCRIDEYVEKEGKFFPDVLTYQTFPDQNRTAKFNPALVKKADVLFNSFKGLKILFDAHDNGDIDAYYRFPNSREIPRIKSFPSHWFLSNYNVILPISLATTDYRTFPEEIERIRKNGREKFKEGYNLQKSANTFYEYLKKEVK